MSEVRESRVHANGVDLKVFEAGDGFPVLLLHGFPELAYSWRHQLPALADAGLRAIAPDQRGYGGSSRPEAIEDYSLQHLTGDALGLLDALGCDKAIVVGHDWGAGVAWDLGVRHPERFAGVVGMSGPFLPRFPMPPTEMFRQAFAGKFHYIVYFQEPGVADEELGRDPARTMWLSMAIGTGEDELIGAGDDDGRGLLDRRPAPTGLPAWLSQDELDFYIREFTRTGFTGGLNWYRNADRNWHNSADLEGVKVVIPSLFITGSADSVLKMFSPAAMDGWLEDHRGNVFVDGAGHWVQQEKPDEVNVALIEFARAVSS